MNDRKLPQCPTGYLKDPIGLRAMAYVEEFSRMKSVTKSTNSPYFRSIDTADPRTISAFVLIESENSYIDRERREQIAARPPQVIR